MATPGTNGRDDAADQRGPGAWIAAVILIAVGVVFLFQNMGYAIPGNWWALFLLIPAVFALGDAWKAYQRNGRRFGSGMAGSLITALVLVVLAAIFLFDLDVDWNLIWPAILIVIGLGALAKAYWRN
jgi:drug/metabolite transporter (DMT)-like permease